MKFRPSTDYNCPAGNRFAVVSSIGSAPSVSFWTDMRSVLSLLVHHANSGLSGFTVWERRTPKAGKWTCIADGGSK